MSKKTKSPLEMFVSIRKQYLQAKDIAAIEFKGRHHIALLRTAETMGISETKAWEFARYIRAQADGDEVGPEPTLNDEPASPDEGHAAA